MQLYIKVLLIKKFENIINYSKSSYLKDFEVLLFNKIFFFNLKFRKNPLHILLCHDYAEY